MSIRWRLFSIVQGGTYFPVTQGNLGANKWDTFPGGLLVIWRLIMFDKVLAILGGHTC